MTDRVCLNKSGRFIPANNPDGHGRTGEIKKGSWVGKTITIGDQSLNKGSLIDFLNTKSDVKLKKSWFGIIGGASDEEVLDVFQQHFPLAANPSKKEEPKAALVSSAPIPKIPESELAKALKELQNEIQKKQQTAAKEPMGVIDEYLKGLEKAPEATQIFNKHNCRVVTDCITELPAAMRTNIAILLAGEALQVKGKDGIESAKNWVRDQFNKAQQNLSSLRFINDKDARQIINESWAILNQLKESV